MIICNKWCAQEHEDKSFAGRATERESMYMHVQVLDTIFSILLAFQMANDISVAGEIG
jgi:hypothetical protein